MNKNDYKRELVRSGIIKAIPITESVFETIDEKYKYATSEQKYRLEHNELTQEEMDTVLLAKITSNTKTTKNVCLFFAVMAVVSIFIAVIAYMEIAGALNNLL